MPALIVLVDVDRTLRQRLDRLLSEQGYLVATAHSFHRAKDLLDSVNPDLLITGVRLDAFNGLQLAIRTRLGHARMPIILTDASGDPMLEAEARRQGATMVLNPLENPEFLRSVHAALDRPQPTPSPIRRWYRKRVHEIMEARVASAPVKILDISHGGVRLAFDDQQEVPAVFDVEVPAAHVTVRAQRVWTAQSPTSHEMWCGAEISELPPVESDQWQDFVDSVQH
jgi:DNA-binding response OmpR family regulator